MSKEFVVGLMVPKRGWKILELVYRIYCNSVRSLIKKFPAIKTSIRQT